MPNVLILPRSADYSEEVWAEIRAKAAAILRSFFVGGIIPGNTTSEDEDEKFQDLPWQKESVEKQDKEHQLRSGTMQRAREGASHEFRSKQLFYQA
jgi:hypothetical protein